MDNQLPNGRNRNDKVTVHKSQNLDMDRVNSYIHPDDLLSEENREETCVINGLPHKRLADDPMFNAPCDPTVENLPALLAKFNRDYFDNELGKVNVEWDFEVANNGGQFLYSEDENVGCVIKLSAKLLKTNREVYEVLLHEMIHAYIYFETCKIVKKSLTNNGAKGPVKELTQSVQKSKVGLIQGRRNHRELVERRHCVIANHRQQGFILHLKGIKESSGLTIPIRKRFYLPKTPHSVNPKQANIGGAFDDDSVNYLLPFPTWDFHSAGTAVHKIDTCFHSYSKLVRAQSLAQFSDSEDNNI